MKEEVKVQNLIRKVATFDEMTNTAMKIIVDEYQQAVSARRSFLLELSGGRTPVKLYRLLHQKLLSTPLEFPIEFFIGDERYVPWEDSRSNNLLVRNNLLNNNQSLMACLHDFPTQLSRSEAAVVYAKELNELAPNGFDLAILGIGKDGHFASIFPGFADWESDEVTVVTETTENEVMERLSISPKYLFKAQKLLVLLAGQDKSPILDKLMDENLSKENFPAKFLLQHPNLEIIFSEEAAY